MTEQQSQGSIYQTVTDNDNQFLVLDNAMYSKIGTFIFGHFKIFFQTRNQATININHIVSITEYQRWYDKLNKFYYIIKLTNGQKIYVNDYVIEPTGLLSATLSRNPDFERVSQYIKYNKIVEERKMSAFQVHIRFGCTSTISRKEQ